MKCYVGGRLIGDPPVNHVSKYLARLERGPFGMVTFQYECLSGFILYVSDPIVAHAAVFYLLSRHV